jgi:hypothetical protein
MEAVQAYMAGKPFLSDAEFDELKRQLKVCLEVDWVLRTIVIMLHNIYDFNHTPQMPQKPICCV